MSAIARPTFVTQVVRLLPAPLLRALDAWAHRQAQRRAQERRDAWLLRQAERAAELQLGMKVLGD
jgi:hypothetical protein